MTHDVLRNIRAHDRAARSYERAHGEIFNRIEQERLRTRLAEALKAVRTMRTPVRALDFGAGTGNVTAHLLALGAHVTAADVSPRSLEVLRIHMDKYSDRVRTIVIGPDLEPLADRRFDLVALYSVLHHIPNYLGTLERIADLVLPGGTIYIDHEAAPAVWNDDDCLTVWQRRGPTLSSRLSVLRQALTPEWIAYRLRKLRDRRATLEGDLHVWPDDHIEWADVDGTLVRAGFEVISVIDHLLYRRGWDVRVHEDLRNRCADVRSLLARRVR